LSVQPTLLATEGPEIAGKTETDSDQIFGQHRGNLRPAFILWLSEPNYVDFIAKIEFLNKTTS
jgi:hypothetical protein